MGKRIRNPGREQQVRTVTGMVFRMLRETRGLTQDELAKRADVQRTTIVNIEVGTQGTPLHMFLSIAHALKMRPNVVISQIEQVLSGIPEPK